MDFFAIEVVRRAHIPAHGEVLAATLDALHRMRHAPDGHGPYCLRLDCGRRFDAGNLPDAIVVMRPLTGPLCISVGVCPEHAGMSDGELRGIASQQLAMILPNSQALVPARD